MSHRTRIIANCKENHDLAKFIEFCKEAVQNMEPAEGDFYKYRKHKVIWDCQNIKKYSFVNVQSNILCPGSEHLIEVNNNEIIRSELVVAGFDTLHCKFWTINELFEIIEVATDDRKPILFLGLSGDDIPFVADIIDIEYDDELGFPIRGRLDYVFGIADEEFSFSIQDVVIIER